MSDAASEGPSLEVLARDLERLERVTAQWETERRATVEAIRQSIEQLHREALVRLVRTLRDDPESKPALVRAAQDPWVRAIFEYHGLLRASAATTVRDRLEGALAKVRPTLAAHGGNVEIALLDERAVTLRLVGTCDGCAFSGTTSREVIEVAVRAACPELAVVQFAQPAAASETLVPLGRRTRSALDVCAVSEIPERGALFRNVQNASLLLTRFGSEVYAYPNACPHLGMPLDDGMIEAGVLTCRYHGFQYDLESGESLTARDISLARLPVEISGDRVHVDVGRVAMRGAS